MLEVNLSSFFGSSGKGLFKSVKILENLENGFWKVSTSSGIIKVFSEEKLIPGKTVSAFIRQEGNLIKLETLNQEKTAFSPDFFYPHALIQTDYIMKTASRLNIRLSDSDVYLLKKYLKKKRNLKFMVPFLIDAFDKGFRSEIQLGELCGSFDGRREKNNSRGKMKEYLKKQVSEAENSRSALFLYNHLKTGKDHWVVVPYNIAGKENIEGAVRLRISGGGIKNIIVNAVKGESDEWGFFITAENKSYNMRIYCSEPEKIKESESFGEFRKKLQNLRVKIDDNVKDIAYFSGFGEENTDLDISV